MKDPRVIRGRHFHARIKRWWWPPTRKRARMVVLFCDSNYKPIMDGAVSKLTHRLLYGEDA